MAVPPPPFDKKALRSHLRRARSAHVAALGGGRTSAEANAAERVMAHVPADAIVALYHPLRDELGPLPLAAALFGRGHRLALPHVAVDRVTMRFHGWSPGDALIRAGFGVTQPADGVEIAPTVVIVPLVGFDRRGGRIGQGAGHYDRALAALPGALRIGYAWSVQEVDAVPRDPWDVPLHAIATEREWISVNGRT